MKIPDFIKKMTNNTFINHQNKKVEDDEIEKLREIKERIKKIKTVEELELMEQELITLGLIDATILAKLRKKRRRKRSPNDEFIERIRCDEETINRVLAAGRAFKEKEIEKKEEEKEQNRDERIKEENQKPKEKGERVR